MILISIMAATLQKSKRDRQTDVRRDNVITVGFQYCIMMTISMYVVCADSVPF